MKISMFSNRLKPLKPAKKRWKSNLVLQKTFGKWWKMSVAFKFGIFFDEIRAFPIEKSEKLPRYRWEKTGNFQVEILITCSADFQCFSTRTSPYFSTWNLFCVNIDRSQLTQAHRTFVNKFFRLPPFSVNVAEFLQFLNPTFSAVANALPKKSW